MMKKRKGSTLVMALMVFSVLMVLSTFIVGFMVTENKQSLYHQHKTQAYYIARGGAVAVEAAILKMDEAQIDKLNKELDKGEVEIDEIDIDGNIANVVVKRDGDKLNIESVASVRDVVEKVTKVMETETISTGSIEIDLAIFSHGDIIFSNGVQSNVKGNIGINSASSTIKWQGGFNDMTTVFIPVGSNKDDIFDRPQSWGSDPKIEYLDIDNYPLPILSKFPQNESMKDFTLQGNDSKTIVSSDNYRNLTINSETRLYIDATENEIILNIKNFNLNNGHVILIGNNKVTFYVNNMTIGSGSTINYYDNESSNSKNFELFYNGINELIIAGSQKIYGNLFIDKADIKVTGGGSILGNIISRGKNITISGGGSVHMGLIYSPDAKVKIEGGGSAYGAIISNTFNMSGGGVLEYKPEYIDTSIINVESSASSSSSYKPGYFK